MNVLKLFKRSARVELVKPSEQVIACPVPVIYPSHDEVRAMAMNLSNHYGKYVNINIEVRKHTFDTEVTLEYYIYIEDNACGKIFNTFEDLRLFVSNLK